MANFRVEFARLEFEDDIGFDPNAGIDTSEMPWIDATGVIAGTFGLNSFEDYYSASFEGWKEDNWFDSADGLNLVNKFIKIIQRELDSGAKEFGMNSETLEKKLGVLKSMVKPLEAGSDIGYQFRIVVSDVQ